MDNIGIYVCRISLINKSNKDDNCPMENMKEYMNGEFRSSIFLGEEILIYYYYYYYFAVL